MSFHRRWPVALLLFLALVAPALAQDPPADDATAATTGDDGAGDEAENRVRFTGEVRFRGEAQNNYTDFNDDGGFFIPNPPTFVDDDLFGFGSYRVRFGLEADITESLLAHVELQVANAAGVDAQQRDVLFSNDDNFDLYTGYIHWGSIGGTGNSLRIGRQEIVLGNGFLFGNEPFYNGTSFDAIRYLWTNGDVRFNFWYANTNENFELDADTDIWSMEIGNKTDGGSDVSFYVHWILDGDETGQVPQQDETLLVLGFRWTRTNQGDSHPIWNIELVWQDGRVKNAIPDFDGPGNRFIAAWGGEALWGWNIHQGDNDHQVYFHLYYGSGDQDIDDVRESNDFRLLFQNRHGRLGNADIVQGTNVASIGLTYKAFFGERHSFGVDLMTFIIARPFDSATQLAAPAGDFSGGGFAIPAGMFISVPFADPNEDDLGQELDLWYDFYYSENLSFDVFMAYFVPGKAITQINQDQLTGELGIGDAAWRVGAQARLRF